jgi:hypothetical protein
MDIIYLFLCSSHCEENIDVMQPLLGTNREFRNETPAAQLREHLHSHHHATPLVDLICSSFTIPPVLWWKDVRAAIFK